jgi:hypothetical protein
VHALARFCANRYLFAHCLAAASITSEALNCPLEQEIKMLFVCSLATFFARAHIEIMFSADHWLGFAMEIGSFKLREACL